VSFHANVHDWSHVKDKSHDYCDYVHGVSFHANVHDWSHVKDKSHDYFDYVHAVRYGILMNLTSYDFCHNYVRDLQVSLHDYVHDHPYSKKMILLNMNT